MAQYRDRKSTLPPAALPPWQGIHPVLWFAQRYPLVFWSGLFSGMMLLTALATALLVTAPPSEAERSPAPIVSPVERRSTPEFPAIWALGAITASCAIVSLLLTTSLSVGNQKRRLIKHPQPTPDPRQRAPLELTPPDSPPQETAASLSTVNLTPIATWPHSPTEAVK